MAKKIITSETQKNPSRSQLKRESIALQALGEKLLKLSPSAWENFPLSADIKDALKQYKYIPSREGKRRQLQFIGRLMREENSEEIKSCLDAYLANEYAETQYFHNLENLRDRLLSGEPQAWQEVEELSPELDHKKLKQLLTIAKNDPSKNNCRAVFRYLKNL